MTVSALKHPQIKNHTIPITNDISPVQQEIFSLLDLSPHPAPPVDLVTHGE